MPRKFVLYFKFGKNKREHISQACGDWLNDITMAVICIPRYTYLVFVVFVSICFCRAVSHIWMNMLSQKSI